jgi:hypothetical protein
MHEINMYFLHILLKTYTLLHAVSFNDKKTTFDQYSNMRKFFLLFAMLITMISCNEKVKDINMDEEIATGDFIKAFKAVELPVQFKQDYFEKKESDSNYIKSSVVSKFIPDSVFKNELGKTKDVKFYRKGRYAAEETGEIYLFLTAQKKEKRYAYIICFDKEEVFKTGMLLSEKSYNPSVTYDGSLDKRLAITKMKNSSMGNGKAYYNKSVFVYNTEGVFTLILTESNEPVIEKEVYNPIDTLPMTQPLSGNYIQDKKNFVAVRDGGKSGKLLFFIHVDKYGKSCTGSLRGDITQVKPKVFQYNKADDHCVLEFTFSNSGLLVKELEACGNHRSVRCSFDGRFSKQRKKNKK